MIQRCQNQLVDTFLAPDVFACEERGDGSFIDLLGQSVAAKQQLISAGELPINPFDLQILRISDAKCLRNDVAMWVPACLFGSDDALFDQSPDVRVIGGDLSQFSSMPVVDPAVPNPGRLEPLPKKPHRDDRGSHRQVFVPTLGVRNDLAVRPGDRIDD